MMIEIVRLFKNVLNYEIRLFRTAVKLVLVTIISSYQFTKSTVKTAKVNLFENKYVKQLNFGRRRLLTAIRTRIKQAWYFVFGNLIARDLQVALIDENDGLDSSTSIFYSNRSNDRQLLELIEKMDILINHISFWPNSIKEILLHVESRLLLEADYASRILNHSQSTRAQLNKDELSNFFDFRPIFVSIVNQEFNLSNLVIQSCESLLTSDFIEPLEEKTKDFRKSLSIIKRKWNNKINEMQTLINHLRKSQKLYLQCALYYVKLSNDQKFQLDTEKKYQKLLFKCETDYKSKIHDVNKCLTKLEVFKNRCLDEMQLLIDETSKEIKRLCSNYVVRLYPDQKNQLLNQLFKIVPEIEFRKFIADLKIPELPSYTFTKYDEIKC